MMIAFEIEELYPSRGQGRGRRNGHCGSKDSQSEDCKERAEEHFIEVPFGGFQVLDS
jgi:hypothetical protein